MNYGESVGKDDRLCPVCLEKGEQVAMVQTDRAERVVLPHTFPVVHLHSSPVILKDDKAKLLYHCI